MQLRWGVFVLVLAVAVFLGGYLAGRATRRVPYLGGQEPSFVGAGDVLVEFALLAARDFVSSAPAALHSLVSLPVRGGALLYEFSNEDGAWGSCVRAAEMAGRSMDDLAAWFRAKVASYAREIYARGAAETQ